MKLVAQTGSESLLNAVDFFDGDGLKANPTLSGVVHRYLANATIEPTEKGVVINVPTVFHMQGTLRCKQELEALSGTRILSVEVTQKAPRPKRGFNPPSQQQVALPLTPQRPQPGGGRATLQPRLQAPKYVCSQSFELPYELTKRWAASIEQPHGQRVLWLHGGAGTGKTHLIRQLHEWIAPTKNLRASKVVSFFHEWRQAIERKDILSFNRKYRSETDVLILENLDELQGKPGTQKEVLYTVNAMLDRGAAIAVSSSMSPPQLKEFLEPQLYSRLLSGMAVEMPQPDRGLKEKLWWHMLEECGLKDFPLDLGLQERLFAIPTKSVQNVKSIFANAIARLSMNRSLSMEEIQVLEFTHGGTRHSLSNQPEAAQRPLDLIDQVAKLCGVSSSAVLGRSRRSEVIVARRFVALALSRSMGLTNSTISHYMEKDPSTISHALSTVEAEIESNRHIGKQWSWICSQLGIPQSDN